MKTEKSTLAFLRYSSEKERDEEVNTQKHTRKSYWWKENSQEREGEFKEDTERV